MAKNNVHAKQNFHKRTLIWVVLRHLYPDHRAELQQACRHYMNGQIYALMRVSNQIEALDDKELQATHRAALKESGKAFGIFMDNGLKNVGLI